LALPPDSTDTFMREVDENLRRDRALDFAKKYGGWLIAGVIVFLIASGGFIYWQSYSQRHSEGQVEQIAQIFKDIGSGDTTSTAKRLDDLSDSGSKGVRATAQFTRADIAIQQNDTKLAIAKYREIAADGSLPQPYRDVALIRQTALEFDSLAPDQVIDRLKPLTKPGNPWFGSAGEMTAMALIKAGKKDEAAQLFSAIAKDKSVPESIRARAVQVAGTLGVDASSALRGPAQ
jgi:hypothetical protein